MAKDKVEITTRNQLKGYGASSYIARVITKDTPIFKKEGQANVYKVEDVIASTRIYIQNPRIKATTTDLLQSLLQSLLKRLGNVVEVPFYNGTDPELSRLTRKLSVAMSNTDKAMSDLKATVASIKGKRKK